MKQLELSLTQRLSFAQLLGAQKADGQGAARLRPFHRVMVKIRLDADEKRELKYKEFPVPGPQGGMLLQSTWDGTVAADFPAKKFLIDTSDADACAKLLDGNTIDIATGDIEWIEVVLPQLQAKDVEVVAAAA